MTIKEVFELVVSLYGLTPICEFIKENSIELSYYKITEDNSLKLVSGNSIEHVEKKNRLTNNVQGGYSDNYKVDDCQRKFIVLFLRLDLIPEQNAPLPLKTELIAIHELAHLIDQQGINEEDLNLEFNECDQKLGEKISDHANYIADKTNGRVDPDHNSNFGAILSNLIRIRYTTNLLPELLFTSMENTLIDIEDSQFYEC